jgi:hypothetical protein
MVRQARPCPDRRGGGKVWKRKAENVRNMRTNGESAKNRAFYPCTSRQAAAMETLGDSNGCAGNTLLFLRASRKNSAISPKALKNRHLKTCSRAAGKTR